MKLTDAIKDRMDRARICDDIFRRMTKYQGKNSVKRYYASTIDEVKAICAAHGIDVTGCDHRDFIAAGFGVLEAQRITTDVTPNQAKRRPGEYVWVVIGAAGAS